MEMANVLLDLMNVICKIAFITYAWITMMRINAYISENKDLQNRIAERCAKIKQEENNK